MANAEHLKWLLEGVQSWNARRDREPFWPDLEGADVRAAFSDKSYADAELLPLAGIDFSGGNLKGTNFHRADLSKANLAFAQHLVIRATPMPNCFPSQGLTF